jgi:hypothetical protein
MAYTVTELINRAWYLSGKYSSQFQTVTGPDLNYGLYLLNALLAIKTANQRLIPYYTYYTFAAVSTQEKYVIPALILCETLTFDFGEVRYAMNEKTRFEYFATARANNVFTLPSIYYIERAYGGSNLYMYPKPDSTYQFNMHAKFSLQSVVLNQDLSATLDAFYIEYLRYALAEYMCQETNIVFQPQSQKRLDELENQIFDISPIDFTMRKTSVFTVYPGMDYPQANLSRGFYPGAE